MDNDVATDNNKKKSSFWNWLLWWKVDQDELDNQVSEYNSLKIYQSARGQSFLLLLFSSLITILFIIFSDWGVEALIEVVLCAVLGFLIFKGHKWAIICAMILWTIDKFYAFYDGIGGSRNSTIHLAFWVIYMHAFYLAFRVERTRKQQPAEVPLGTRDGPNIDYFNELNKLAELRDKGIITEEEFNLKKKQILNL